MKDINSDWELDHAAFQLWISSDRTDNLADLEKAKRYIPIILNEVVSKKQHDYIMRYYVEMKTIYEIAEEFHVKPSTVSRTIRRGIQKAYGYLRFLSPLFMNLPPRRRIYNRKQEAVRR